MNQEALSLLEEHGFPGNVRELKNLMEYALIKSQGAMIRREHLRFIELPGGVGEVAPIPALSADPPVAADRPLSPEERIHAYVRERGSISNTDCRELLSVDLQRASYLLKKLHAEGVLVKQGERRWTRYSLPSASS
jgi:DNA-binding NtrC family response regulator